MADESKSAKKNKQRAQKRQQARIEKIKQDGLVEQILEREDPVMALKKKLQQAKDNKDHKLAAEIRKQIWMAQDQAAGYSVPKEELEEHHVENEPQAAAAAAKPSPIQVTNRDPKNTPAQQTETSSSLNPLEKRLRNLKKKLQQINSLKEKQEKGETLEDTQIEKLKTEEDLIEEINEIESALAEVRL